MSSLRSTKFIADAMLGSLARKLRILGFDTTYYRAGDDKGMLKLAKRERRLILTSDKSLHCRAVASGLPSFLLTGNTDLARASALVHSANESGVVFVQGDPLCSVCGSKLRSIARKFLDGHVSPNVLKHHRLFLTCDKCDKIYWKGTHWKRIRAFERSLRRRDNGGR